MLWKSALYVMKGEKKFWAKQRQNFEEDDKMKVVGRLHVWTMVEVRFWGPNPPTKMSKTNDSAHAVALSSRCACWHGQLSRGS